MRNMTRFHVLQKPVCRRFGQNRKTTIDTDGTKMCPRDMSSAERNVVPLSLFPFQLQAIM